jgi:hypothetical protein
MGCRIARSRSQYTPFNTRHARRATRATRATRALPDTDRGAEEPPSSPASTVAFLATLAVGAFAGAAVVKYGSLLTDTAFRPNPALALALVFSPPIGFAAWMVSQDEDTP